MPTPTPAAANYSYSGLADCYLKPYGVAAASRAIGSVSVCQLTPTVDHKEQKNYGRDGGLLSTRDRLIGVAVKLTLESLSVANLALALRGTSTDVASGQVATGSEETHTAYLGGLIRLAFINPTSVVVTDSVPTTYVEGTDYIVTGAGIIPLASGTITDGSEIKVSYSYSAQKVIEALTEGVTDYTLNFDGINDADNNSPVVVDLWRLRPAIVKTIDLIGDNYATLEVDGQLLLDPTQTATGASKFFRWIYGSANV